MKKKVFLVLVILMTLSLIGIIFVQGYYISNSVANKQDQFTFNVKKALSNVSNEISDEEYMDFVKKIRDLLRQGVAVNVDTTAFIDLYIKQDISNTDETLIYKNGILEENYKLSSAIFDIGLDSVSIKKIISKNETKVYKSSSLDGTETTIFRSGETNRTEDIDFEPLYLKYSSRRPIHKRITVEKIDRLIKLQLLQDDIDIEYEFAVYNNDLATKVKTENFDYENAFMSVPFFDNKSENNYRLLVEFPDKKEFIWSSIIGMIALSIIFTTIIIVAYSSALFQLMKQRQISEIKTDFINNMTHEFKTPIATINLALDSIKNPKIIDDKEKVKRYLHMIREENKRMHAQVENVLRISKLEKNELNISKDRERLHDLIEDAISHVELIVEDRGGHIETSLKASKSTVLANETHFTNVLVNILDNAIKYSPEAPIIKVDTLNVGNNIIVNIKDHGSGMSKAVAKRVFEKFYREHTGNVHNVKGHGLGLAYVKRIVDDHHGHISVESEKDKGSTFTIKLPLIS
ncbi:ATP-binding protein [Lacinutrix sp. MedPE-SW]|uniref:sensor histidine kinase n=1 Tax=Lacinutrix sp. MedPE-SW TaxID=1860087 RepID=UPI00091A62FD|nr:ATP-binding protein [Lacinutrix sp. MedPE-SW]OIQ16974.1 MAG: two-component sensor histidine kinase [Lacinutrix sp. MedPE-SW]